MSISARIQSFIYGGILLFVVVVCSVLMAYQNIVVATEREAFAQQIESHTALLKQVILSKNLQSHVSSEKEWLTFHTQLQVIINSAPALTATQQVILNSIKSRNNNLKALLENQQGRPLLSNSKQLDEKFGLRLLSQLESIRADAVELSSIAQQYIRQTIRREFVLVSAILLLSIAILVYGAVRLKTVFKTSLKEIKYAIKSTTIDSFVDIKLSHSSQEFDDIVKHFNSMNKTLKENSISISAMQQIIEERTKVLEEVSRTDPLTQVANRRALIERGELEFSRCRRSRLSLPILLFDCDLFKNVNDKYGHHCGDLVLQHVSKVCKQAIRDVDFIARYGGEEFVVILPDADLDGAIETARRMQHLLSEQPMVYLGQQIVVTISIGISMLDSKHADFEQLLKEADKAMYLAKQNGRNRIETLGAGTPLH